MSLAHFDFALSGAAVRFFTHADADDQSELLELFRFLAAHPAHTGDFAVLREGRLNQVSQHGRFLVTYWPDHAARELRVTELAWS